ncbi:hypothetical protein M9H77_35854 [Catharanthus roseus]|uniref:Uncharacterized protein n=1 Tax=Catharanthus roseus TaxID=4058 RepID=A0ACB9ZQ70_CATRO|nr:hypothetical protein M9H77_35854 [Catharanthus roseus]
MITNDIALEKEGDRKRELEASRRWELLLGKKDEHSVTYCPCKARGNHFFLKKGEVKVHLVIRGFIDPLEHEWKIVIKMTPQDKLDEHLQMSEVEPYLTQSLDDDVAFQKEDIVGVREGAETMILDMVDNVADQE